MCGIFGFTGPPDPALLTAMAARLRHRGPDEKGTWSDDRLSLGVTRLAIVDVDHGQQPLCNEDGSIVLAFNGEIYNHRALRAELERRGHRFVAGSDGEVVVHLFEEEGEAALARLAGMFALALWDARRERLLLARDGFGMKTVCYTEHEERFAFASEVKALLCLPRLPRRLDTEALGAMAAVVAAPLDRTLFSGVRQLPPGHLLWWQRGRAPEVRPFWRPRIAVDTAGESELAAELERRLLAAVESHLASEVPMGATLSGGVDSSLLVAMASRVLDRPLPTYTVSFPGDFDERPQARLVADHCRTDHHEITPDGGDVLRLLPHLLWCVEEPDRGPLLAHEMLFARAAEDVRVLLMGEGSDELFGGYLRMKTAAGAAAWLPPGAGRAAYLLAQRGTAQAASGGPLLRDAAAAAASNGPLRDVFRHYGAARGQALLAYEQAVRLPSTHVLRIDRMAMAHSIEARLPFLDRDVAELANRLPLRLKTRWRGEKRLLRRVARAWLPTEIAERPKVGLRAPAGPWLRAHYLDLAEELLTPANVAARGCFAPRTVDRLLRRMRSGRRRPFDVMDLHFFVLLEGWHRVFIDPPVVTPPADDLLLPGRRAA